MKELHLQKRFLVTGAAGFIGFHLARKLSADKSNLVVGIDNFNDYYDVSLKIDRAFRLSELSVSIYKGDVCDDQFLKDLMLRYNFTHVIHLAGQAGVRYSMKDPLTYVTANYECFLVLLEALRNFREIRLIYASSSSVYGKNSDIPFGRLLKTDVPGNMYAATKSANELLGRLYCELFNISAVGLRLFTVYGPWGRPDMAIYKFTQLARNGEDIPLYHVSDTKSLARDFTYIDDVVGGIESAVIYRPAACGEVFNLGFGRPVNVLDMIKIIEKELGLEAKIRQVPLPASEILQTWANISVSRIQLGFNPVTSIGEGIRKFIHWHKSYVVKSEFSAKKRNWFKRLETENLYRQKEYGQQKHPRL